MTEFVTPPPVEQGGSVAVIAASSGLAEKYPHVYELGIERIENQFGLTAVEYPTATRDSEYLASHPEARAADVMDAFRDPEIGAVITTIGGHDQLTVLDHLDPSVLQSNPTRFFGISDNTNLCLYLFNQGIVSFYGGTLMTTFASTGSMDEFSVRWLERALFSDSLGEIEPATEFADRDLDWEDPSNLDIEPQSEPNPGWEWRGGTDRVEGRVWGGCLPTVLGYLAADRYVPPLGSLDGAILLLETSERIPDPEQVRMELLPIGERGIFEAVDGVMVGRAKAQSHHVERTAQERRAYREQQRDVIESVVTEYNPDAPIVFDVDVGHTDPEIPVPVGGHVVLDPEEDRIAFE